MRKTEVHRSSVYIWKEKALEPHKRGPKFKRLQKTPEEKIRNLREEMERLRGYLEEKEKQIHLLREKLEPQRDDSKPVRCPNCGCEKVYRNGTYEIRPKGFFDNLKARKEELIQRFICPYCGKSFHIKKQSFPHSSLKNEVRRSVGIIRTDGKTSLRRLQDCIRKILCVDVSLGFIYKELMRVSQIAERINLKVSSLVSFSLLS